MEKYNYNNGIEIECDIPSISLETMKPKGNSSLLKRLSIATKPRVFTLSEDWFVSSEKIKYDTKLNGTIKIPSVDEQKEKAIKFDGASIPLPWLISLLTIGILRPLGVMFLASIIHDYAYKYGHLKVSIDGPDGSFKDHKLKRITADLLLRDCIRTFNKMPIVGYMGWFFVRIGWVKVKYHQETRKGKKPFFEYAVLLAVLALFIKLGLNFGFATVVTWLLFLYLFYCFLILIYTSRTTGSE